MTVVYPTGPAPYQPYPLEIGANFTPLPGREKPVFRQNGPEYTAFYAPNCLCVVSPADAAWFETTIAPQENSSVSAINWGAELWRRADLAMSEAENRHQKPFSPECLTLYLNNRCNLRCVYCYTDTPQRFTARLDLDIIVAAARLVAENCRKKKIPFYVVFHGGGEPTLHRQRVERILAGLDAVAQQVGVSMFRYVATNGVMSAEKAAWLAHHFDRVGLSCDGPAGIQHRQRPTWTGGNSLPDLERTAHILHAEGCRFSVRATITQATLSRQAEIADYICRQFSPDEINFEPVYLGGRSTPAAGLEPHHADQFVTHFWKARHVAKSYHIPLTTSGSRVGGLHGPYCNVFRSVLNVTPGGVATACFKTTDAGQTIRQGVGIGAMNHAGYFEINQRRLQLLRQQLHADPPGCAGCFNRYHCTRHCPDHCPLDRCEQPADSAGSDAASPDPGFRCRVQKLLALATLNEAAQKLWSASAAKDPKNINSLNRYVYGTTTF